MKSSFGRVRWSSDIRLRGEWTLEMETQSSPIMPKLDQYSESSRAENR